MSFCIKCGRTIDENAAFCSGCGEPVKKEIPVALVQNENPRKEECEFLDNTYNLLRWEQKAWSIASKFFVISGIIYAAICSLYILIGIITSFQNNYLGGFFTGAGLFFSMFGGGTFIGLGIVSKKAAEKLDLYIDTLYTDLSISYKRCDNVGMLVFNIILGVVSPIFFIINFVRMKTNRDVSERIINNQSINK